MNERERFETRRGLEDELRASSVGEVRFGVHDRLLYSTDASLYQVEPLGVVVPSSIEGAVATIRACAARRVPMLARGGGTSLAGQCTNRAVVIDFSAHCRGVLSVDGAGRRARVEPGVTLDALNAHLLPYGLFFAPDPATASHACIGGVVANNAAGARSIRYGRASENLRSLDVAWWDGTRATLGPGTARDDARVADITRRVLSLVRAHEREIRERFPRTLRRNAGYGLDLILGQLDAIGAGEDPLDRVNLAPLICGSEGTLAFVLGAEVMLHPIPAARSLCVIACASTDDAVDLVPEILATSPTAVELIDDVILSLARERVEYRAYAEMLPGAEALVYVEHTADETAAVLAENVARLRRVAGTRAVLACSTEQAERAWRLRRAGEPLLHAQGGARRPLTFVEDNAVPAERLGEFVRAFRGILASHGTRGSFWAHASVGVLHVRPLLDLRDGEDRERMERIAREVAALACTLGGTMSGEHGDGRARSPLLRQAFGEELVAAFKELKSIFDPHSLLNPGNIVEPSAAIAERLRVIPQPGRGAVSLSPVTPAYEHPHGLLGELERCNGAGLCRRMSPGTMCPSYRATLDERHSTRGRANAMRLSGTGQGHAHPWADPETIETLDLCLSCKACKSECPSGVDLARLRSEFLHQSHVTRGRVPMEAAVFSRTPELLGAASCLPRLANAMGAGRLLREALHRAGLVDRRRSMPTVERSVTARWGDDPADSDCAVLADCFTGRLEPEIPLAVRDLLRSHGYRPRLLAGVCCGRADFSLGTLDRARGRVELGVRKIGTQLSKEIPIVVCEPSCLSAFRDEWLGLRCSAALGARKEIASRVVSFGELLSGASRRATMGLPERAILHEHCHEKALGMSGDARFLAGLMGERLCRAETGCCGLAGSWGFPPRRFDLSMAIARQSLAPSVEGFLATHPGGAVLATGTSCRHQIRDVLGVRAEHPATVLARGLRPGG